MVAGAGATGEEAAGGEPFRLTYRLHWDERGLCRRAALESVKAGETTSLTLEADGAGHWRGRHGEHLAHLDGCLDVDIRRVGPGAP
jgi:hypothetical protein